MNKEKSGSILSYCQCLPGRQKGKGSPTKGLYTHYFFLSESLIGFLPLDVLFLDSYRYQCLTADHTSCLTADHTSINISVSRLITPVSISVSHGWSCQYQYQCLTADHASISVSRLIMPVSISVSHGWSRQYQCLTADHASINISVSWLITPVSVSHGWSCQYQYLFLLFLRLLEWMRSYWYVLLVIFVVLVVVCVFLCACILRKRRSHRHTLPMELRK